MFSEINPDVVVHSAAITDVNYCENHKEESHKVNVDGTKNVLESALKNKVKKVIFSSSAAALKFKVKLVNKTNKK